MKPPVEKTKKIKVLMYHNPFGQLIFPKFNVIQANIFMYILYKLKSMVKDEDKLAYYQSHPNEFYVEVRSSEALKEFKLKRNNKPNIDNALKFMEMLKQVEFRNTSKNKKSITYSTLFISTKYTKDDNALKLWINPTSNMIPLFRNFIEGNFTKFALVDYYALTGVYEKALFRYISRYANSEPVKGNKRLYRVSKDELCELLHVSKESSYYKTGSIKSLILNKAIKSLRYYFKDISVKCVYNHAKGNQDPHTYYDFTWTKDLRTKTAIPRSIDKPKVTKAAKFPDEDDSLLPF